MASNNLTPQQDLLIRKFYERIATNDQLFAQDPVGQRNLKVLIMRLLGYDKPTTKTYRFGETPSRDISAEWEADRERAKEAAYAIFYETYSPSADETNSSESGESAPVRPRILPEDV